MYSADGQGLSLIHILHTSAEVAELLSVPTEAVTPLGPATHIFTHIEWQMQGYRVELPPKAPLWGGCVSIPVAELFASYPIRCV